MKIEKTIELVRENAKKLKEDIEFCVQKSISGCDECIHCDIPCMEQAEVNKQIAEWLEELKVYQQHEIVCHKGYNAGYNKALDDFVKFAKPLSVVEEVAEEYNGGWIPVKTRPMTEEEKEYYSEYLFEGNGLIYECPLPDDGQEVLITSKYGSVEKTIFYTDCGNYFENYEDYEEVMAWMPIPEPFKESDENE